LEHRERAFAQSGFQPLQGRDEVSPEADWVIVALVQRNPRDALRALRYPLTQERSLAKAGRGGDEGERVAQDLREARGEARARDEAGACRWEVEFGGENGDGHELHSRLIVAQVQPASKIHTGRHKGYL
jgi:hypothetical protein